MTKAIAAVIIVLVCYGVWELFLYWEKVKNAEETSQKQEAAAAVVGHGVRPRAMRAPGEARCTQAEA